MQPLFNPTIRLAIDELLRITHHFLVPSTVPTLDSAVLGARSTRQRDAILEVIRNSLGPLSVPEIHQSAAQILPKIGIATIYRTLKLLQEGHQINPVILPSGESRFESANLGHHEHFQCRKCERVFDIKVCPVHLPRGAELQGGFIVEDHELTLFGLCPSCQG